MRFLISVIDDLSGSGTPEEMVAIDAFNDQLQADGRFIFGCGVSDPSAASVIDNRKGAGIETGKPLFASPDNVSGFWLIHAEDLETARKLAFEGSKACNRKVELRPLHG